MSFLDVDERLLALLDKITILRCSLTDVKRITERCAIGFIEGGVANEENIHTLQHFRENCDILISVGACAIWGGVPAMRNMVELKDYFLPGCPPSADAIFKVFDDLINERPVDLPVSLNKFD